MDTEELVRITELLRQAIDSLRDILFKEGDDPSESVRGAPTSPAGEGRIKS